MVPFKQNKKHENPSQTINNLQICHKDHSIKYQGVKEARCDCGKEKYCECHALVSNGEKIVLIPDGRW